MSKKKYKGKIPLHLRELLYTTTEALAVSGMSRRTFFNYLHHEPIPLPTSKAFVFNWSRRRGFPRRRVISVLSDQRIRTIRDMQKAGMSTRKIAPILGICQQRVVQLSHAKLLSEKVSY